MKFFILLFCLLLQAFFNVNTRRDHYHFLNQYAEGLKPLLQRMSADRGWSAVLCLLVPVLILILILNFIFRHIPIFYFVYGLIILFLCLDFRDMRKQLTSYFTAFSNENLLDAQKEGEQFVEHTLHQDKSEISRAITEAIFVRSLNNIFAVIFWFMLLGPFGAVLYAMTKAIRKASLAPEFCFYETYLVADFLKEILDWLPIRFVTLTFALIGHFGPVFSVWVDRLGAGLSDNRQFLIDGGLTALHTDLDPLPATPTENQQALHLVTRTLWTWMIIIGVLTVTSWL